MESFIQLIARDLIKRFGTNLRNVTVVFPNKRAGLFMNQQLAAAADRPVWAPRYRTISEMFDSLSDFTRCDDIAAVCELYGVYAAHVPEPESLDRFYGWGEIMLADFDDIDKHLVDTQKLFRNVLAIKELETDTFLTDEQERALGKFFEGFSIENNSRLKEKFLHIWDHMIDIYTDYNRVLRQKGLLYEGALYRDVIENLEERAESIRPDMTYVFVGFNVLNDVEKRLFRYLQDKGRALFYWDYDVMYVNQHTHFEAGTFIRQNLKEFPNALPEDCYDHLLRDEKKIEMIATSSENAQARYIPQWLETSLTTPEQDTAIVLCNESLLQPVLHSLPDDSTGHPVKYTNVTMGFPMADTPVFSLINALLNLQTDGYDPDRHIFRTEYETIVRDHPYFSLLNENEVFSPHTRNKDILAYLRHLLETLAARFGAEEENGNIFRELYNEALYRSHNIICRFISMTEDDILNVQPLTLRRLIRNVLSGTTIPFHGEPAAGLQVMGVLETRNLNFRHILMLSVNEGMLPKTANDTSFIPYDIRKAFGLTTIQHKIAVYAFYFYRLLQRTEHITFMYNTATDGMNKGEMSRFLRQILAETELPVSTMTLQAGQDVVTPKGLEVEKTPEIMAILRNSYRSNRQGSRALSPSALNTYIDCPLKFYYQQIARIRKPKNPENGIDAALFGTIFHDTAELVYKHLTERNPIIRKQDIEKLLESGEAGLLPFVEKSFLKNYFLNNKEAVFYNGQLLIARKVVVTYLRRLLEHDMQQGQLYLESMEEEYKQKVEIQSGEESLTIDIGGKIDRMDRVMMPDEETGELLETIRIIDYKTGGTEEKASNMEQLITPVPGRKRPHYTFQTFLYAWVVSQQQRNPVSPALFYVHKAAAEDYSPIVRFAGKDVTSFAQYKDDFEEILKKTLAELFNPDIPFLPTDIEDTCTYCDYCSLCRR